MEVILWCNELLWMELTQRYINLKIGLDKTTVKLSVSVLNGVESALYFDLIRLDCMT